MPPAHTDFNRAFRPGEVFACPIRGDIPVRLVEASELVLPSGRIIACEPSTLQGRADLLPFTRRVVPGRYPVLLCLAKFTYGEYSEERVAGALVRFRPGEAQSWEMALTPGQDPATLRVNQYFGYGVDGGRGGFLDADVLTVLEGERREYIERLKAGAYITSFQDILSLATPFFRRLWEAHFIKGEHNLRQWVVLEADPATGANVIDFESGEGDGCYASYWGLDGSGEPCCLATDFDLLTESLEGRAEFPLAECLTRPPRHPDLDYLRRKVRVRYEAGPPPRLWVDYRGGPVEPTIESGGKPVRRGCIIGGGERGSFEFLPEGPLAEDARLILTYCLGTRAL
jgi:hypothetical protein